ncbi:MAG: AAA family ATPase [Alphaproteobacteria bacterium]|nr:AAA family ATPase [Alphaproteobacteria bacterium]
MVCDSQTEIVEFLSAPKNYGGAAVQRIDTHLSHVFLVGARVYKVKRAIRYDFVNFSTVDLRKRACENEVKVNRRTAPEMYLGVVPLYCDETGVNWEGRGEVVEWAVEMVRFDPGQQFDELLAHGKLQEKAVIKLADKISQFHLKAERKTLFRSRSEIGFVLDRIVTSLHGQEMSSGREKDVARWMTLAHMEYEKNMQALDARRRHGWVRHCHGDLHLANICMFNGEPTPFDAIEFNEDLADIDVLYDLAFVLMDLINHNRSKLANLLLNRYLCVTRDYAGLTLLRLFLSMRAAVRAMVLNLSVQPVESKRLAGRYLDLALEFLIGKSKPHLVVVGGYSGVGKSTLARALALEFGSRCGAVVLRSDVIRKHLDGCVPEARLGDAAYSEVRTEHVYKRMFKDARRALRAGQSVVLDATFLDPLFRERARSIALNANVPFRGVWLTAPRDILVDRVSKRFHGASDATVSVLNKQLERAEEPKHWRIINAGGAPRDTLNRALAVLDIDDAMERFAKTDAD